MFELPYCLPPTDLYAEIRAAGYELGYSGIQEVPEMISVGIWVHPASRNWYFTTLYYDIACIEASGEKLGKRWTDYPPVEERSSQFEVPYCKPWWDLWDEFRNAGYTQRVDALRTFSPNAETVWSDLETKTRYNNEGKAAIQVWLNPAEETWYLTTDYQLSICIEAGGEKANY